MQWAEWSQRSFFSLLALWLEMFTLGWAPLLRHQVLICWKVLGCKSDLWNKGYCRSQGRVRVSSLSPPLLGMLEATFLKEFLPSLIQSFWTSCLSHLSWDKWLSNQKSSGFWHLLFTECLSATFPSLDYCSLSSWQLSEGGYYLHFTGEGIEELRHREFEQLVQEHRTRKWLPWKPPKQNKPNQKPWNQLLQPSAPHYTGNGPWNWLPIPWC